MRPVSLYRFFNVLPTLFFLKFVHRFFGGRRVLYNNRKDRQMFPFFPFNNDQYGVMSHPIFFCQVSCRFTHCVPFSNVDNSLIIQLVYRSIYTISNAAISSFVLNIFQPATPSKIFKPIVGWYIIKMPAFLTFLWQTNPCHQNQSMHKHFLLIPLPVIKPNI